MNIDFSCRQCPDIRKPGCRLPSRRERAKQFIELMGVGMAVQRQTAVSPIEPAAPNFDSEFIRRTSVYQEVIDAQERTKQEQERHVIACILDHMEQQETV